MPREINPPTCPWCEHLCPKSGEFSRLCNVEGCECRCERFFDRKGNPLPEVRLDAYTLKAVREAEAEYLALPKEGTDG